MSIVSILILRAVIMILEVDFNSPNLWKEVHTKNIVVNGYVQA